MITIPDKEKHHRRSIRLREDDYSTPGAYFVTICAGNREFLFGKIVNAKMRSSQIGKILQSVWNELRENYPGVDTDVFIIMPNHIHGIIALSPVGATPRGYPPPGQAQGPAPTMPLPNVVHPFKSLTTAHYRRYLTSNSLFPFYNKLWQRNYYEHVVRNEKELNRIREYILYNALQWAYDRENPEHVQDTNYDRQRGELERSIFEKQMNRQDTCSARF